MLKIFITLGVLLIITLVSGAYGYYQMHQLTEDEAVVPTHYLDHSKASLRFSLALVAFILLIILVLLGYMLLNYNSYKGWM